MKLLLSLRILKAGILSKVFGKHIAVRKSWEETPKGYDGDMVSFLDWFDATKSVAETVAKAASDWKYRFTSLPHFAPLPRAAALEIGFGGGRLLSQSSKNFTKVYGVDIHSNFAMTERFLASQQVTNAILLHRDQIATVPDGSIDLVYSFIVFQHFDSLAEVDFYLDHIHRILSPQGIAHIYFGKNKGEGVQVTSDVDFRLRDCSLFINPQVMRDRLHGRFTVLTHQDSLPRDPITGSGESVQAMIVFRKS